MLTSNVGSPDKIIRIILGLALIAAVFMTSIQAGSVLGIVMLVASAILILTALVGTCPLYSLLRIKTKS